MSALPAIAPVGAADRAIAAASLPQLLPAPPAGQPGASGFSDLLVQGVEAVDRRMAEADSMVRAFALDGSVPLHQVTFALEEARLSLELFMQVRTRLVEAYQRVMEMQL